MSFCSALHIFNKEPLTSSSSFTTQTCTEEFSRRPRSGTRTPTTCTPTGRCWSTKASSRLATGSTSGPTHRPNASSAFPCSFRASEVLTHPRLRFVTSTEDSFLVYIQILYIRSIFFRNMIFLHLLNIVQPPQFDVLYFLT